MMVDPNIVETYTVGKEGFIVALCEAMGVPEFINAALISDTGRPPEVSYVVLAMLTDLVVFLTFFKRLAVEKYFLKLQLMK